MKIADLFINIFLKDTGVEKGLKKTETSMQGIVSSSLLAKAAVLGVIAALERMTGAASQRGMDLYKFQKATGLSAQELQKWQYAAGRFDVSGQEMAETISNLQGSMTDMLMGKGAPEAMGLFSQFGIELDPTKFRDTFYLMGKIQEFAKKAPPDVARNLLKSLNINDNVLQMLKSMDLEKDKISKKFIITDDEITKLTEINKAWKDMWFAVQSLGTKFVAKNGLFAVDTLRNVFTLFTNIASAIADIIDKSQALKVGLAAIAAIILAVFAPITAAVSAIILLLSDVQNLLNGKDSVIGKVGKWFEGSQGEASRPWEKNAAIPEQPWMKGGGETDNSKVVNINAYLETPANASPKEFATSLEKEMSNAFYSSSVMNQQKRSGP